MPRVVARMFWCHSLLPTVNVLVVDVSTNGIGIVSPWRLDEGACEIKLTSLPPVKGIVKRCFYRSVKGKTRYHYGLQLSKPLHRIQLYNILHGMPLSQKQ
ncbi:hypothetical protein CS022_11155 [Veronia nyctiphanis]|uniref:PilZ domain-containing protein n=2 Tax=Veronia nyctiphanis TaxID=1278244 RepID=A0A4Q0YQH1_9GAMM|nr:hypothetical protein CS022_11155 [Veronia nyctiphanis]